MDSDTIENCLRHLSRRSKKRTRVFVIAADEMSLVNFKMLPCVIVQNDQPHSMDGSHWSLFWIEEPRQRKNLKSRLPTQTFFCSFGTKLSAYHPQKPKFRLKQENRLRVQNPMHATCGLHSIYVGSKLMEGRSFTSIISDYSKTNLNYNDKLVLNYFNTLCFFNPTRKRRIQICVKNGCK